MTEELKARFDAETQSNPIVIYMKGNALFPQCGFSALALNILKKYGTPFVVDVLKDPAVRDGIKAYSNWPTIPQVYIRGQFIGGSDIVREMDENGELARLIKPE